MGVESLQLLTPDDVERRLADRIRDERLRRNWKQSTLAERSGVSVPTIRRYEKTGRTTLRNLLLLLEALGRLDEFGNLLRPPPAASIEELEARVAARGKPRRRGTR
ncbi:MAG: helix-turn-helix transcriptional regulator [Planctomycetota bacterium]